MRAGSTRTSTDKPAAADRRPSYARPSTPPYVDRVRAVIRRAGRDPDAVGIAAPVSLLSDAAAAVAPSVLDLPGLDRPGLYSWWVDKAGAAELSTGLGHTLEGGLIYAGLAGATRWPSGKSSANTLANRISGRHLGGSQSLSTLRRTLAVILATARGEVAVPEVTSRVGCISI